MHESYFKKVLSYGHIFFINQVTDDFLYPPLFCSGFQINYDLITIKTICMKSPLFIVLTILLHFPAVAQTCLPGGILFTSQAQIDAFPANYPGCTEILGYVKVAEIIPGSIVNLDGLAQIMRIHGDLEIYDNNSLNDMTGLSSLLSVGGKFVFHHNDAVTTMAGLSALQSVGHICHVLHNPILVNLNGLNALTTVTGEIVIGSNPNLVSLNGLNNLQSTGGLFLDNNPGLQDLTGLDNLTTITSWGLGFALQHNHGLLNLTGLNSLTSIGGIAFQVLENNSLQNVAGLESLQTLGCGLAFYNNPAFSDLNALSNLTSIAGELYIGFQPAQVSMSGLENIDPNSITSLYLEECPQLSYCHLPNLCDYLAIPENPAVIIGNATGCGSREEILAECFPDSDADGISDVEDNCIDAANPDQTDSDCDQVGDACDQCDGGDDSIDSDQDGIPDCADWEGIQNMPEAWLCGNNQNKVLICHQSPGNSGHHVTICVDQNAVSAHLAHGDYLGPCNTSTCESERWIANSGISLYPETSPHFEVFPNPASNRFLLWSDTPVANESMILIFNSVGELVLKSNLEKGTASKSIPIDHLLPGVYIAKVLADDRPSEVIKLVVH